MSQGSSIALCFLLLICIVYRCGAAAPRSHSFYSGSVQALQSPIEGQSRRVVGAFTVAWRRSFFNAVASGCTSCTAQGTSANVCGSLCVVQNDGTELCELQDNCVLPQSGDSVTIRASTTDGVATSITFSDGTAVQNFVANVLGHDESNDVVYLRIPFTHQATSDGLLTIQLKGCCRPGPPQGLQEGLVNDPNGAYLLQAKVLVKSSGPYFATPTAVVPSHLTLPAGLASGTSVAIATLQTPLSSAVISFAVGTNQEHGVGLKTSNQVNVQVAGPPGGLAVNNTTGALAWAWPSSASLYHAVVAMSNGEHSATVDVLIRIRPTGSAGSFPLLPSVPPVVKTPCTQPSVMQVSSPSQSLAARPPARGPTTAPQASSASAGNIKYTWTPQCSEVGDYGACFVAGTGLDVSQPACGFNLVRQCITPQLNGYNFTAGKTFELRIGDRLALNFNSSGVSPASDVRFDMVDVQAAEGMKVNNEPCAQGGPNCLSRIATFSWVPQLQHAGKTFFVCVAAITDMVDCPDVGRRSPEVCFNIRVPGPQIAVVSPGPNVEIFSRCNSEIVLEVTDVTGYFDMSIQMDELNGLPNGASLKSTVCTTVQGLPLPSPPVQGIGQCSTMRMTFKWAPSYRDEGSSYRVCFVAQSSSGQSTQHCFLLSVPKCIRCVGVGESLSQVAKAAGAHWLELWGANPQIAKPEQVQVGQPLNIGALLPAPSVGNIQTASFRTDRSVQDILKLNPDLSGVDADQRLLDSQHVCVPLKVCS